MNIEKLWEGYKFPTCEKCKKDCAGHLDYDNLCSNLNYLKEYAEKNYEKNKESFVELNSNYHMPKEEQDFIDNIINKLKNRFRFKKIDILDGKGIIVYGAR